MSKEVKSKQAERSIQVNRQGKISGEPRGHERDFGFLF